MRQTGAWLFIFLTQSGTSPVLPDCTGLGKKEPPSVHVQCNIQYKEFHDLSILGLFRYLDGYTLGWQVPSIYSSLPVRQSRIID